jgi:hypothetical protein
MDHSTEVITESLTVQVEQTVFTSVRSRKSQGYHMVAVSPGVDEALARSLSVWGPSHASLLSREANAESLNFHPVADDWYAVSRTVHGGPEYSGRGGLEVFTTFLLVRADQLQGYQCDPLRFALTAQSLGYLRFQPVGSDQCLPSIDMPDHAIGDSTYLPGQTPVPLHDVLRILKLRNRVAVLGLHDPRPTLSLILKETPVSERLGLSFCTGLRPSVDRGFRVHFADSPDSLLHAQLASQGIDYITTI